MSEPLKYGRPWWEVMKEVADENAHLKAEVERLRASSFVTAVSVEQYERVVKAGDAMAECILKDCIHKNDVAALNWYDAKGGKQP